MFVKIVLMVCPSSATEAALHVEDFSVLQHHEDASGNLCRNGSDRLHAEAGTVEVAVVPLKSSKAPTNYFTPNILRKSWSRLVVSVVHLDALAFPVAAT